MISKKTIVVIPTLGQRKEWLRATVESLLTQNIERLEIRVVAPEASGLQPFCDHLGLRFVACNRKGLSVAINEGWRETDDAEFVTWIGDDDLFAPGSLSRSLQALSKAPSAAMVYGRVRYIDARGKTLWVQNPTRLAARYMRIGKNLVPQPGSLLRRTAVMTVGGVDESLKSAMDQDLFIRLQRVGKAVYIPFEVAAFRLHESSITAMKGGVGAQEGEQVRSRHAGPIYKFVRPITRAIDRIVYALVRRLPYRPAPLVDQKPYCQIDKLNTED